MCKFDEQELLNETAKRLYRLPQLLFRIKYSRAELKELKSADFDMSKLRKNANSFVSLIKSGMRLSPMDAHYAQIELLEERIRIDTHEVSILSRALKSIKHDKYYGAIYYKFFKNCPDDEIAKKLTCNPSTLRRNRARLLIQLINVLYGVPMDIHKKRKGSK
ncbi:MAG: hypothetical protein GX802_06290 [Clostridiales bacterium]|nr:hypothetical protein [Clostridiales bacterium]